MPFFISRYRNEQAQMEVDPDLRGYRLCKSRDLGRIPTPTED